MVRLLIVMLLVVFVVFAAVAIWAYQAFGFWGFAGAALGFVAFFWILTRLVKIGLQRVFFMPFKMKGAVLKAAGFTVHSITRAGPPVIDADYDADDDDEWQNEQDAIADAELRRLEASNYGAGNTAADYGENDEEANDADQEDSDGEVRDEDMDWYHLDVTITPKPSPGPFQQWEPSELVLVAPDAKGDPLEDHDLGRIANVEIWQDGEWQDDDVSKYPGSQRVRLHAGVNRGTRRAKLMYYFHILEGELVLPESS